VDASDAREYLTENHNVVVVTRRRDGSLQTSPNTCGVLADGRIVISSRQTAYKVKNLRRDPRVTICGFPNKFMGRWIQIDGTASIVPLPDAMDGLVEYYRTLSGGHPDWDDYRAAMERDQRLLIVIEPDRVGPDRSG
jgi:PPOX class probable F420-dependent enzyme